MMVAEKQQDSSERVSQNFANLLAYFDGAEARGLVSQDVLDIVARLREVTTEPVESPGREEGPKSFTRFLEFVGDGEAHATLSAELRELLNYLHQLSVETSATQKGKFQLNVKIIMEKSGGFAAHYDVNVTKPKPPRSSSTFHMKKKNWSIEDPRQGRLFRDVNKLRAGEAREVQRPAEERAV